MASYKYGNVGLVEYDILSTMPATVSMLLNDSGRLKGIRYLLIDSHNLAEMVDANEGTQVVQQMNTRLKVDGLNLQLEFCGSNVTAHGSALKRLQELAEEDGETLPEIPIYLALDPAKRDRVTIFRVVKK